MEKEKVVTSVTETPQQVVQTTERVVSQQVVDEHPQGAYQKKKVIFRTYQIVWYIVGVIEGLLGFRITLQALGANPASGFTHLIYTLSYPFAAPFRGILGTSVASASVFDWSILIAAVVYLVVGFGLVELLQLIKPVSKGEVERTVDQ